MAEFRLSIKTTISAAELSIWPRCQIPLLDLAWTVSSLLTVSVRTVTTQLETSKMAPPVAELKAMTDAFEGIDRLAEGAPRTDGAPNFRRVS